jgi:ubiquinone/menaquinone biosynthesis C-methylase UbiE
MDTADHTPQNALPGSGGFEADDHRRVVHLNREYYDRNPEVLQSFNTASRNCRFEQYLRRTLGRCRELIGPEPLSGLQILDVGTGQGHLLPYLAELTDMEHIHGLDVSGNNLALARRRFPGVQFHQGDFVRDFTPPRQFNLITAYSVLHHVVDWRGFLAKAVECLAPGGVLYLDHDPMHSLPNRLYSVLWRFRHRGDEEATHMEYHAFSGKGLDPFTIARELGSGFRIEPAYSNVGLIQEILKLTGWGMWGFIPSELKLDMAWKRKLRNAFLYFRVLACKVRPGE